MQPDGLRRLSPRASKNNRDVWTFILGTLVAIVLLIVVVEALEWYEDWKVRTHCEWTAADSGDARAGVITNYELCEWDIRGWR